jgi:recombination protein RecT
MTDVLSAALDTVSEPQEAASVRELIARMKPEIEKSLQSPQAAETLLRHYYTAIRFNPLLLQCTADSMAAALLLSAQVGLEPGPLGHVYLVPYRNAKLNAHEVVWMLGYTGIIQLGRNGGAVGLRSTVVWDCDDYEPPWENEKGLHWHLKPGPPEEREERVGVLVVWREERERQALHCPPSRIDTALKASAMKDASRRGEDWYWRKTGVRFARPWLPLTPQFALAARSDDAVVHYLEPDEGGSAQPVLDPPEIETEGAQS